MRSFLWLMVHAVMMAALAACADTPGTFAQVDAAQVDAPTVARWAGVYDVQVDAVLTIGVMRRATLDGESFAVTTDGARATWDRPGPCVVRWTLDGDAARADPAQVCRAAGVDLRLMEGSARLSGETLQATLRWTLDGGGAFVETITGRRRP